MGGITDSKDIEFEQTPGDSEGQRSLACCSPQGEEPKGTAFLSNFPILGDTVGVFAKLGTLVLLLWGF